MRLRVAKEGDGAMLSYGYFLGGDPRCFKPDPEGLRRDELERWREDCEAWDKRKKVDRGPAHVVTKTRGGFVSITVAHYGLGTTYRKRLDWRPLYEALRL